MERIVGYARILAQARVQQMARKPMLGKPYLYLGQCQVIWSYFFQLGGVLAARHLTCLDEFGQAFLGAYGEAGAVEAAFGSIADKLVSDELSDTIRIWEYVGTRTQRSFAAEGELAEFLTAQMQYRIKCDSAAKAAWNYASDGAAVAGTFPHYFRDLFQRTHAQVPDAEWKQARKFGLDIPESQDNPTYKEVERDEDALFKAYCEECCPEVASILWAGWPEFSYPWPGGPSE